VDKRESGFPWVSRGPRFKDFLPPKEEREEGGKEREGREVFYEVSHLHAEPVITIPGSADKFQEI